jgi:dolichyldiphosphatase
MNIPEESVLFYYLIKVLNVSSPYKFTFLILLNSIINKLLKSIIKEDRPIKENSYGMPSGHAQFMWFLFFYKFNEQSTYFNTFMLLNTLVISYDRIYKQKHTVKQVIVGAIIGSILGLLSSYI